jgi:multiple sugar transport system substrate-binding protein
VDSLSLVGLRHYLKLLRDQDISPYNLKENSSEAADRFVRSEQLILFGTSEFIRKVEFDKDVGGLKESPLAKDGLISVTAPKGPVGNFTFVGGSHLTLPMNANPAKRAAARDLFLFMVRADNIDYYSRQSGFIPPDGSLIRIWMQDSRYNSLINGLENNGRSCQNIPEWSEIEMAVNAMVNAIAKNIALGQSDVNSVTAGLVLGTHEKINGILKRSEPPAKDLLAKVEMSLMQPVEETRYAKDLGIPEERSEISLRLVIISLLGFVAAVLLLVYMVRVRKR